MRAVLLVGDEPIAHTGYLLSAQVSAVPEIQYRSVPDFLHLPADLYFGEVTGVAVNSKGHIFGDDGLVDLSFGASRQDQARPFDIAGKVRMRGWRVVTDRGPHFRIPKVSIRCGSPRTFHDTHEAVFAFERCFETMASKNQDLCIA